MPIWRIALFILIVTGIVFGWHWYLYVRLAKDPSWPEPWQRVIGTVIWGGAALMPLGLVAMRVLGRPYNVPIGWIVYTWMGFALVMFFALVPADIVRSVASKFVDADRRLFLSRALAGMVGLVGTGAGIAGMASVLSRVAVKTVRVPIAKLPKAASGY